MFDPNEERTRLSKGQFAPSILKSEVLGKTRAIIGPFYEEPHNSCVNPCMDETLSDFAGVFRLENKRHEEMRVAYQGELKVLL
jgi:hypothetical protein